MSFISTSLSVVAYANGFTLWNYQTEDKLEDINKPGYFKDTAPFMRIGDRIMVTSIQDNVAQSADIFVSKVENNEVWVKETGVFEEVDADLLEKILQKISASEDSQTAEVKTPEAQSQTATANGQKKTA